MKLLLFLRLFACVSCLFCGLLPGFAQEKPVLVISSVEQTVKLLPAWRSVVSEESFPNYPGQDSAVVTALVQKTKTLLQKKWQSASVSFDGPETIRFSINGQGFPLGGAVTVNVGKGELYVQINQVIAFHTTAADKAGMPIRYFNSTCQVQVRDKVGNVAFAGKAVVPFSTVSKPGYTQGTIELSKADWVSLFERSLAAALDNQTKRTAAVTFFRPSFSMPAYASFLEKTKPYTLQESVKDGITVAKGDSRLRNFSFTQGTKTYPWKLDQHFIGRPGQLSGKLMSRALLLNGFNQNEYEVTAECNLGSAEERQLSLEELKNSPVAVRCTSQRLLVGDFNLTPRKFEGQMGYDVFTLTQLPLKHTYEIKINDEVQVIVQKGGLYGEPGIRTQNTYLLVNRTLDENQINDVLLVYLMYQTAYTFGQNFLSY
jgi:hypothetical protein